MHARVKGRREDSVNHPPKWWDRELPRASRAGLPASWPTLAPQRCDVESWLHRLKGLFHPHAVDIHRSIVISIGNKPTIRAFVDSLGERLFHDASIVRTHLCRVAGIDLMKFVAALSALYER